MQNDLKGQYSAPSVRGFRMQNDGKGQDSAPCRGNILPLQKTGERAETSGRMLIFADTGYWGRLGRGRLSPIEGVVELRGRWNNLHTRCLTLALPIANFSGPPIFRRFESFTAQRSELRCGGEVQRCRAWSPGCGLAQAFRGRTIHAWPMFILSV